MNNDGMANDFSEFYNKIFVNADIKDVSTETLLESLERAKKFSIMLSEIYLYNPNLPPPQKGNLLKDFENHFAKIAQELARRNKELEQRNKELEERKYINQCNTSLTNLTKKILNNPTRIESTRQGQITQNYDDITQEVVLTYKGTDSECTVTLEQFRTFFAKRVQNGAKIFNFLLKKLNEQNYKEHTDFFLKELVELGIYTNPDSAYRGLKSVTDKLMRMHIEGRITVYHGKKKKEVYNAKMAVVSGRVITYNKCQIILPSIIRNASHSITVLPKWAYTLESENAYMLVDYIFYLAKQNTYKIKENGYFTISLEAIRMQLGLPSPDEVKENHNRNYNIHIINPIEEAITAIENSQQENELTITQVYDHGHKTAEEYLAGFLKIGLSGEAMEYMENRATTKAKMQAETKRIEEKKEIAKAIAKEKNMSKTEKFNNKSNNKLENIPNKKISTQEKKELIYKYLKETPEKSNRQIAKEVGAHHSTVSTQRKKMNG